MLCHSNARRIQLCQAPVRATKNDDVEIDAYNNLRKVRVFVAPGSHGPLENGLNMWK